MLPNKRKPDNPNEEDKEETNKKKDPSCHGSGEATKELTKNCEFFTDNLEKAIKIAKNKKANNLILLANNNKQIRELGEETLNSLLLDCRCSSNVAGDGWWNCYYDSLSPYMKIFLTP